MGDGRGSPPATYRHVQRGRLLAALMASGVVALVVVAFGQAGQTGGRGPAAGVWITLAVGAAALVAAAVVFSTLTIVVDATTLRWHFAFGVLRRTVPRADVVVVEATTTRLFDGIGVHRGLRGWVYNVALGPAVRIVRQDGRAVLLGTDDPGGLVAALTRPSR